MNLEGAFADTVVRGADNGVIQGGVANLMLNSGSDHERQELVYFMMKNDKILVNVPDSFSRDACGFDYRNGPFRSRMCKNGPYLS